MKPEIIPRRKIGGSAFCGNNLNATRPISRIAELDSVKVVSLTEWCAKNFITKRIGRKLIKLNYLIAFRRHHVWWVAANPDCLQQLTEYLGIDSLFFDADN